MPEKISFKSAHASFAFPINDYRFSPWTPEDVDRLEKSMDWGKIIQRCRYFYKRDPLVATVINRIVDLSINDIIIKRKGARESIKGVVESIKPELLLFLRSAALEYLLSGLVIPEVEFERLEEIDLKSKNISRFSSLMLPTDMWIRDPLTIRIKSPLIGSKFSYFMKIPEELAYFIKNKGKYQDGTVDVALYNDIIETMPELVANILANKSEILLDNPFVVRINTIAGETYPQPYLQPALESLAHKRNLRRMDYSLASRVISAIQLITLGNDEFPLTEDNEDQLEKLKEEMLWRERTSDKDMERIFQLFGNHTLNVEWIMPDVVALLDDKKYITVNHDIALALGFPKILVTGETERSFTSDPDIATVSPLQMMNRIRDALLPILTRIVDTIVIDNNFGGRAVVEFRPINMMAVSAFVDGLQNLYDTGNLSREDYAAAFGFEVQTQFEKRAEENKAMEELKLDEFAPQPHSNAPVKPGATTKPAAKKSVVKPANKKLTPK